MMSEKPCPFCEIVAGREFGEIVHEWDDTFAIHPLNPVTPGHVLVIPKAHVSDFTAAPEVSGRAMTCAAELAPLVFPGQDDWNLITSKGRAATQSVFHLHLHLVPRAENDGLALPWYSGKGALR